MPFLVLKYVHVLGAIVLLGTGAGIAFFMWMAHRTRDVGHIARTAATVVVADFLFTATAVVAQPVTGFLLARAAGWPLSQGWLALSLLLYVAAGLCWIPVVFIQMRMRDLARTAVKEHAPLSAAYDRLFRCWVTLGFPGFGAVLAIVWLMIAKPSF
ncbi:MAG TPA: DUF2269 domain-containing protein [Xanthobacteraceae bacterium]|jgi:uncharacterized membrane protein|nr:DUF2269 domain-containing protein [Xanthobacteraceae bacterium]